jgi:hypothetical protein
VKEKGFSIFLSFKKDFTSLIWACMHEMIITDAVSGRNFEVSWFQPLFMFLIRACTHEMFITDAVRGRKVHTQKKGAPV